MFFCADSSTDQVQEIKEADYSATVSWNADILSASDGFACEIESNSKASLLSYKFKSYIPTRRIQGAAEKHEGTKHETTAGRNCRRCAIGKISNT